MESLVGIILPPVIEVLNRDVHNDTERFIVAFLLCLAIAIAVDWNQLMQMHLATVFATFGIILAEAETTFNLYWKDSFLREKLQKPAQMQG